jgi:soluble lytic murein transglycosylase
MGDELLRLAALPVPRQLLPRQLRELLLPRPWESRVRTAAGRHALDPALLWALMRGGSGFDPRAISPWGGRGLLLVDPPSAERLAPSQGLPEVRPEDLFQPRFAIPLGAAHLAELERSFGGRPLAALTAYLAGPSQARLWASWCESDEPAELLTKIDVPEVHDALVRVLSWRAAYAELDGRAAAGGP